MVPKIWFRWSKALVPNRSLTKSSSGRETKWLKNWEQQYSNPETIGVVLSETVALGDWRLRCS